MNKGEVAARTGHSNRGMVALAAASLMFMGSGAALGSGVLLMAAALTATVLATAALIRPPSGISVMRSIGSTSLWIGDQVTVDITVRVDSGIGFVYLHNPVPSMMELVEGSNFMVVWKGRKPVEFNLSYSFRVTVRGKFTLEPVSWEAHHCFRTRRPVGSTAGEPLELMIRARIDEISRVTNVRGLAVNPQPMMDIAMIGNETTEFREIRRYAPGDPIRSINWKATARSASGAFLGTSDLLVNQFEREGKKAIWLFIDASPKMRIGTTLLNPIEHAVEAASTLSYYFLKRGYQLGAHFSNRPNRIVHADSGEAQLRKMNRELLDLSVARESFDFRQAVQVCRHQILRYVPECFIITRLDDAVVEDQGALPESAAAVLEGVRQLTGYGTRGRHSVKVNLVAIAGYAYVDRDRADSEMAQSLRRLETSTLNRTFRRYGVNIIDWNPMQRRFSDVLLAHAMGSGRAR